MQKIQRYRPRGRNRRLTGALGCGALLLVGLVVCGAVGLFIVPRLTGIAAGIVGLQPSGVTSDQIFSEPAAETAQVFNATQPERITVDLGTYGERTLPNDPALYPVAVGVDANGTPLATASLTEDGAMTLCRQNTPVCNNADPRIQNIDIDFRSGGAVVYADVALPEFGGVAQRVGALLTIDPNGQQLEFAGVELNGAVYTPSNELNAQITQMEQLANDVLRQASVEIDGRDYTVSQFVIDDQTATLVLR